MCRRFALLALLFGSVALAAAAHARKIVVNRPAGQGMINLPYTVNDGAGADIDTQTSTTSIAANWTGLSDPQSGVAFEWAIGTTPGGQQIMAFTQVGISGTTASRSGLALVSGTQYYATVRATNGAGSQTTTTSDGVLVTP